MKNLRQRKHRPFMVLKEGDEYRFINMVHGKDADELWEYGIPGDVLAQALAEYQEIREREQEQRDRRRPSKWSR